MSRRTIVRRLSTIVTAVVLLAGPLASVGTAHAAPVARPARHPHSAGHALSPKAAWLRVVSRRLADVPAYLDARARSGGRLAIVLGIDDVALATRYDWPHGVQPTLRVVRHARRLGMAVFFVTGRTNADARRLRGTLRRAGFRWTGICGRDAGRRVEVGKQMCRRSITARGYTVTANISAHQQAFYGGYYERAVLLPEIGRS